MEQLPINPIAIPIAAVAALILGFIWYHPKVFGTAWMKAAGLNEEELKGGNMALILGLALFFALLLGSLLMQFTNHQWGAIGMVGGDPTLAKESFNAFMADYGTAFRTFKHGAFHGFLFGIFGALPIIATNGLFERKSAKYILVNAGYWILTLMVMGAIICGL